VAGRGCCASPLAMERWELLTDQTARSLLSVQDDTGNPHGPMIWIIAAEMGMVLFHRRPTKR